MAKLYFTYGTMSSGKSLELIKDAYNYQEKGMEVLILKPSIDTRDGTDECYVSSRIGAKLKATWITEQTHLYSCMAKNYSCIFVDEAQFLTKHQVDILASLVDMYHIPVMCYGLRTDFQTNLFEGSKRLFELADEIRECRSVDFDGRKASVNARVVDGNIIREGEQVQIGGNESYVAVTRKNYNWNILK